MLLSSNKGKTKSQNDIYNDLKNSSLVGPEQCGTNSCHIKCQIRYSQKVCQDKILNEEVNEKKKMKDFLKHIYDSMAYNPTEMKEISSKVIVYRLNIRREAKVVNEEELYP